MKNHLKILLILPVIILLAIQLFPIFVMVLTSFKTPLGLLEDGTALSFKNLFLGNYLRVLVDDGFLANLYQSKIGRAHV